MKKFPKISHFENVVTHAAYVHEQGIDVSTVHYIGSPKLHGCNMGIHYRPGQALEAQSRNRVVTVDDDHYGFAAWIAEREADFALAFDPGVECVVFGEWCGKGIHNRDAITKLPQRMFFPFGLATTETENGEDWFYFRFRDLHAALKPFRSIPGVQPIDPAYQLVVDFTATASAERQIAKALAEVEAQCPVAASLGIEGYGEGIVWVPSDPMLGDRWWFKSKCEAHKETRQVTPRSSDQLAERQYASDFVEGCFTPARFGKARDLMVEQGKPRTIENMGHFIKLVTLDVIDEEADQIAQAAETMGVIEKDLIRSIRKAAAPVCVAWYREAT